MTAELRVKKAVMDMDENDYNIVTERFLRDLCEENGQFLTPHLNDTLYLHYKGFRKIQNLEKYFNLKSIWLECNGIQKIENLDHLVKLRMMYLHQNSIEKIENLQNLQNLVTLNLSYNKIKKIENLHMLPQLRNIDLSHNILGANADPANPLDCIEELKQCTQLTSVDLSHNIIDCEHGLVEFFEHCQNILCLYLKGNPCVRKTSMYRKRMTYALKQLQYLDDRPVFEVERIAANAWAEGGPEAEKKARLDYQEKKQAQIRSYTQRGRELTEEGKAKRKEQMRRMMESLRKDKEELIRKRDELKALYKTLPEGDQQKQVTYMKMRKIEEDLKTEYYKIIEDKETDEPSVGKVKAPPVPYKKYQDDIDAANREHQLRQEEMRKESERLEREMNQERVIQELEQQDYQRRETNYNSQPASSAIPAAVASVPSSNNSSPRQGKPLFGQASGVVMSTDSESEADTAAYQLKETKTVPLQQYKWTPESEEMLEEVLMKNLFDFQASAKEFGRLLNQGNTVNEQGEALQYHVDAKSLQLRWTDIEIRKYRLKQQSQQASPPSQFEERKLPNSPEKTSSTTSANEVDDDLEDDLPPLEDKPQQQQAVSSTNVSQDETAQNASGSESEGEGGKVAYYTNLEELD